MPVPDGLYLVILYQINKINNVLTQQYEKLIINLAFIFLRNNNGCLLGE